MQAVALLVAALVPLAAADNLYQFCGADIIGHDAGSSPAPDPDTCLFLIPNAHDCATWTNYNGGTCWLKKDCSKFPSITPNAGAVSFLRDPGGMVVFSLSGSQLDSDMPGFDIGSLGGNVRNCFDACADNKKCFAFTWTDYQGGTCWLKSRASAYVHKPGASSYVGFRHADAFGACPRL